MDVNHTVIYEMKQPSQPVEVGRVHWSLTGCIPDIVAAMATCCQGSFMLKMSFSKGSETGAALSARLLTLPDHVITSYKESNAPLESFLTMRIPRK